MRQFGSMKSKVYTVARALECPEPRLDEVWDLVKNSPVALTHKSFVWTVCNAVESIGVHVDEKIVKGLE